MVDYSLLGISRGAVLAPRPSARSAPSPLPLFPGGPSHRCSHINRHVALRSSSSSFYSFEFDQQEQQQPPAGLKKNLTTATSSSSNGVNNNNDDNNELFSRPQVKATPPTPSIKERTFGLALPPRPTPAPRDDAGRPLLGRKKPLKINLDLALYRARQTKIEARRAPNTSDRTKLLREAEAALRRCLDMDPEDGRAYVTLGKLMVQQRRYKEALALYETGSAATGGTNAHIWTAWAYLAAQRGDPSLARKLYDAAIVASPTHAAAYHGWGSLEKAEGDFGRARDIWAKGINATAAAPNSYLYQSLAVLASDLDRPDEARKWFRAGTRTVSGAASHALWQAWALMEQRLRSDPDVVRALYRRGLQSSPRSRYTFLSWGLWEKELGNVDEAEKLFRQGAHLNPRDSAIPQAWALMEEERGNLEAARKLFKRASRADPTSLYVWQAWGCMEQRQGNLDAARELFQQGIWAAPPRAKENSLVFQAWAVLERDAGNAELARELFKCAIKADARSEPSWLAWADMEEELGRYERANELRSYNMQERQIVVAPANFTTLPRSERSGILAPMFEQLAKWFKRYEEASSSPSFSSSSRVPEMSYDSSVDLTMSSTDADK